MADRQNARRKAAMLPLGAAESAPRYSEPKFWKKLGGAARAAGRDVVEKALWLYFAAQKPETPRWAKATVYGALAYFIMPLDAIPDVTPAAGYADDLGVLAFAVATVAMYIDRNVKNKTTELLGRWFPQTYPQR